MTTLTIEDGEIDHEEEDDARRDEAHDRPGEQVRGPAGVAPSHAEEGDDVEDDDEPTDDPVR